MRRSDDLQVGKVMAGAPFLEDVPRKALDRFASQGAVHRFRRGTYLCHQGDPDGDVFFLGAALLKGPLHSRERWLDLH